MNWLKECPNTAYSGTKRLILTGAIGDYMEFYHEPIMLEECIRALNINPEGVFVDGTAGGGSHSAAIAGLLKGGRLICIDRDADAIEYAQRKLSIYKNVTLVKDNYLNIKQILSEVKADKIDGILLDLGVSSHQIDCAERGFSYIKDAPLDMRMDRQCGLTAYNVVNMYDEESLIKILFSYGEERFSKRIVAAIVKQRKIKPIETTLELAEIIDKAIPASKKQKSSHPAKRTFQAIRIEVNGELDKLGSFIKNLPEILKPNGRAAVITFHSLEDRIVKQGFMELQNPCKCPGDLPACVCGKTSAGKMVFKKPITPSQEEIDRNPRAKSAKLRVFETDNGGLVV